MLYGGALSAVAAALLITVTTRPRRVRLIASAAAAAFLMPLAWNSVLRVTGTTAAFSHDAPFPPLPVSWQDTGSGVATLAGAAVLLAVAAGPNQTARSVLRGALLAGLAAFLIDVYTY